MTVLAAPCSSCWLLCYEAVSSFVRTCSENATRPAYESLLLEPALVPLYNLPLVPLGLRGGSGLVPMGPNLPILPWALSTE